MKRIWVGLLAIVLAFTLTAAAFAEGLTAEDEFSEYVDAPVEELEAFAIGEEEIDAPVEDAGPAPEALEGDQAVLAAPADGVELDGEYGVSAAADIPINETYFPNSIFRTYVYKNFDTNHDRVLSAAERAAVTHIWCNEMGICNLTGVEWFNNLEGLYCSDNGLLALNLWNNTKLTELDCRHNELTSLDLRYNTKLEALNCSYNKLTSLDLRYNRELGSVDCMYNQLTSLNVSLCPNIIDLYCNNNRLTSLDVSACPSDVLICDNNNITRLDISKNEYLIQVFNSVFTGRSPRKEEYGGIFYDTYSDLMRCMTFDSNTLLIINGVAVDGCSRFAQNAFLKKTGSNGTLKLKSGETRQIVPTFAINKHCQVTGYTTNKPDVVYIDNGGLAVAKAEGTATITVKTKNGKKGSIKIKVTDPNKPTKLTVNQGKKATLNLDKTLKLTATLQPSTAKSALTFKSSKPKVATVDANGIVTPKKEGTTKITVTAKANKKAKATITIKVVDPYKPTGISITNGKKVTLKVGETLKLGTALKPGTARSALTFKSGKKSVATVDASGLVTAVKKGTAKITVTTYNKKKAIITIKVVP